MPFSPRCRRSWPGKALNLAVGASAHAHRTVDETPAPVVDPGRGHTKTGYFWAIARDDRPWGGSDPPGVVYTYAPGRSAALGLKPLAGYSGIVRCDGYAVYKQMADPRAGRRRCDARLLLVAPAPPLLRHRQRRRRTARPRDAEAWPGGAPAPN
jgi:hypothetical protein